LHLAHDYLASLDPPKKENVNPPKPHEADRAVVTVAPFPAQGSFTPDPEFAKAAAVRAMPSERISVFISQSRFFGESLAKITNNSFSRFMIAPLAWEPSVDSCIADSGAHFELGGYNCQRFLAVHFAPPATNKIIADGLSADVRARFRTYPPPDTKTELKQGWIPIIPLCTEKLSAPQRKPPKRRQMTGDEVDNIIALLEKRLNRLLPLVLEAQSDMGQVVRAVAAVLGALGRGTVREKLIAALGDGVQTG